jgi:hypothetical protein
VSHCKPVARAGADAPRIIVHKETHVEFDFVDARVGQRQAQFAHLVVMGGTRSSRLYLHMRGWRGEVARVIQKRLNTSGWHCEGEIQRHPVTEWLEGNPILGSQKTKHTHIVTTTAEGWNARKRKKTKWQGPRGHKSHLEAIVHSGRLQTAAHGVRGAEPLVRRVHETRAQGGACEIDWSDDDDDDATTTTTTRRVERRE